MQRNLVLLFIVLCTTLARAQHFNTLHDYTTGYGYGWGASIFYDSMASDGEYPYDILGYSHRDVNPDTTFSDIFFMKVSSDGLHSTIAGALTSKQVAYRWLSYGNSKKLVQGGYIAPFNWSYLKRRPTSTTTPSAFAGLMIYNRLGDTVLTRTYSKVDSTTNAQLLDCDIVPGGGYILAGDLHNTGWVVRTDAFANKVSEHLYPHRLWNVEALSNNRFLLGGSTLIWKSYPNPATTYSNNYTVNQPYFAIIDSSGNVVKDTFYQTGFSNGIIRRSREGGYINTGHIDTFVSPSVPGNPYNFPFYLAHLDTNFRMTWITRFKDGQHHFGIANVKQLRNGDYLVMGSSHYWLTPDLKDAKPYGWAARISPQGDILWSNIYTAEAWGHENLLDAVERKDGTIVFTGSGGHYLNSGPHSVWTLSIDSSGCEICAPTAVPGTPSANNNDVSIFPNPTTGSFIITTKYAGTLYIYNMQGQIVSKNEISGKTTAISLPATISTGMYIAAFISQNTGSKQTFRLIVAP